MKKLLLFIVIVSGLGTQGWSQIEKEYLDSLYKKFIDSHQKYEKLSEQFKTYKNKISINSLEKNTEKLQEIKPKIDSLLKELKKIRKRVWVFKSHYEGLKIELDTGIIRKIQEIKERRIDTIKTEAHENLLKIYNYYSDHLVVDEEELKINQKNSQIFEKLLDETNEKSYLGDITIPKDNQVFYFYKYTSSPLKVKIKTISKDSSRYSKKKPDKIKISTYVKRNDTVFENKKIKHKKEFTPSKTETYRFKKLAVEIRDGNFADIKAYVETEDGNLHIFENQIGVSLLRFSTYGKNNYLFYKHTITHSYNNSEGKYSENKMKDLYVKLSDVMVYDYKIGHRYVPHNLIIELPTNEVQNNTTSATYKIQVETNLDKVVELRAYTDFLSLFGDTENALMQIEGRASFFVAPFPVALFGNANLMEVEFIKKLSPYVNYSRFEDEAKYFEMPLFPSTLNKNNALGLLEKRYLTMGLEGNLVQLSSKDFPLNLILFGNLSYQLTETLLENEVYHLKAAAYGPGIKLVFKRFNNFGFTYSGSFMWYDYGNFNDGLLGGIAEYPKFRVYSNEVEVYYHPSNNSSQAVFARLRTFNNSEPNADEAFYQFQFGYKFAIGNRTIKK